MTHRVLIAATAVAATLFTSGCAIHADERQVGTAAGAVVGGTVGHVLFGGSPIGTIGGAAAGAVLGNEVGRKAAKNKKARDEKDDD